MTSSEKSFAVSSLVCLSMRTATLTVSMRTSLPRVRAIRRLHARQAVCSQNPSWRDGYPSRGDWNMPRPAPIHKDSTHDAVRHGCYLGCHARMLRVFPLFPLNRRNDPNRQQPSPTSPWTSPLKRDVHRSLHFALPTSIGASLLRGDFEVAPHDALVNHVEPAFRCINAHGFPVGKQRDLEILVIHRRRC